MRRRRSLAIRLFNCSHAFVNDRRFSMTASCCLRSLFSQLDFYRVTCQSSLFFKRSTFIKSINIYFRVALHTTFIKSINIYFRVALHTTFIKSFRFRGCSLHDFYKVVLLSFSKFSTRFYKVDQHLFWGNSPHYFYKVVLLSGLLSARRL